VIKPVEIVELSNLTNNERLAYEESLKHYRDMINVVDTARIEGIEEGEIKKARNVAIQMLADGEPISKISKYTGLSEEEIADL
jgi:predicted transposase/invertase (TIGR01784 family)